VSRWESVEERFWKNVDRSKDCWLWTGTVDRYGYGRLSVNYKNMSAHRLSAMMHFGMFDKRMFVLHRCDTPRCVRPSHLFLGDQRQNIKDMFAKGRSPSQAITSCVNGHERNETNCRVRGAVVVCRPCQAAASRRYKERKVGK
jgi:hypothetical protein